LGRSDKFLHVLVRQRYVVPQDELVHRNDRNRSEIAPIEWYLGGWGQHVDQRIGDEDLVRIALTGLHVQQRLGARRATLQRDDYRLFHQVVLLDRRLHHARHLVGRPPRTRGHHDLDGLGGFPRRHRRARQRNRQRNARCLHESV